MNRLPKFFRRGEALTVFLSLVVLVMELIAGVGLACANGIAGGTPGCFSALPDWTALAMPVGPLTVFFFPNLLP